MKKMYKKLIPIGINVSLAAALATGISYAVMDIGGSSAFRQGLQFKVEEIADSNQNGTLSVEEMASVYATIGQDPAKQLRTQGFHLYIDQSQRYLRALNQFDPEVDTTYSLTKGHPSFVKAKEEGKHIHYPSF